MPRIAPLFRSLPASTSALAPLAAKPTPAISRLPSASAFSSFARPTSILSALRPSVSPLASTIASSSKPTPSAIWSGIGSQVRFLTYGTTYQPSQRKRKRKHGFLVRLKGGRLGKNILARRRMKGRRFLSH